MATHPSTRLRTGYSDELKAQVIAEWQLGTPQRRIATKYGVPRTTVRVWTSGLIRPLVTQENKSDVDALFTEFITEALLALRSAARLGQDEDWLRNSKPHELYLWAGTLADKVLAALYAYGQAQRVTEPTELHSPHPTP